MSTVGKAPVGFTGTQFGMSDRQKLELKTFLATYASEFHHGDCIGADEEAHRIALEVGIPVIVIHPPLHKVKQANCSTKYPHGQSRVIVREPRDYLDRNKDIVNETEGLIAAPKMNQEELRSGTWATVRYARKKVKWHHIMLR